MWCWSAAAIARANGHSRMSRVEQWHAKKSKSCSRGIVFLFSLEWIQILIQTDIPNKSPPARIASCVCRGRQEKSSRAEEKRSHERAKSRDTQILCLFLLFPISLPSLRVSRILITIIIINGSSSSITEENSKRRRRLPIRLLLLLQINQWPPLNFNGRID